MSTHGKRVKELTLFGIRSEHVYDDGQFLNRTLTFIFPRLQVEMYRTKVRPPRARVSHFSGYLGLFLPGVSIEAMYGVNSDNTGEIFFTGDATETAFARSKK